MTTRESSDLVRLPVSQGSSHEALVTPLQASSSSARNQAAS
ncbi:MAG TPA: hypothetical protein VMA77_04160 [Solirubrobacteraceae bacterium]|nr:hypothetical protein [Solirubrobacteraceae bacterium]